MTLLESMAAAEVDPVEEVEKVQHVEAAPARIAAKVNLHNKLVVSRRWLHTKYIYAE